MLKLSEARTQPNATASPLLPFVLVAIAGASALGLLWMVAPDDPHWAAGLGKDRVAIIGAILFLSGVMSGLSGFGFSAVGAACLLIIQPLLAAPLLQSLSTANQLLSVGQLREDMPRSWGAFLSGPGAYIIGGIPGTFVGVWLLHNIPPRQLQTIFGALLVAYALYSTFKPAGARLQGFEGPIVASLIGFIGGALGGFTAFPGAPVVIWTGLRDLPKAQSRAIVQPYILATQLVALVINFSQHPESFGPTLWVLLGMMLPVVLPGTLSGVMLYRRISDVDFKRISFLLLGVSGTTLLLRVAGLL